MLFILGEKAMVRLYESVQPITPPVMLLIFVVSTIIVATINIFLLKNIVCIDPDMFVNKWTSGRVGVS